jgi:Fe-S oxidoreductase
MKHNIEAVKATGAATVVVTCPGCYRMWKTVYSQLTGENPGVEVLHSSELIVRLIREGRITFTESKEAVTYHDPCELGRIGEILDEPRSILTSVPGLRFTELRDNREYSTCCGSGGDLLASNQELSLRIAKRKVEEALQSGAETLVTACPSCIRSITMAKNAGKIPLNVLDITQIAWKAMVK